MTSLTDSDGKAHEYFGGQKFNEELAKAAANVSTGYSSCPSRSRSRQVRATTPAMPTPARPRSPMPWLPGRRTCRITQQQGYQVK